MTLADTVVLSNLFFHYIFIIVLIGILILQKINRKKDEQRGITPYIVLCSGIAIFMILDTLRFLGVDFPGVLLWTNPFLAITIGSIILWNSYNVKGKINRPVSFVIFLMTLVVASSEVFKNIYGTPGYWLYGSIATFIATMLLYYVVVDFLRGKKRGTKKKICYKKIIMWLGLILFIVLIVWGIFVASIFSEGRYSPRELSGELNVYNWENYFDENASVLDDFEKEFGVKVNLYTFESEEEVLDAVKNYRGVYDVIITMDGNFETKVKDGLLENLDLGNIPNIKNIDSKFEIANNKDFEYAVPYLWGTTGLAINTKYVTEDVDSWDILWNSKYRGKVGILNNEQELFGLGARYVGTSLIPSRISDLQNVGDFLKLQKKETGGYMGPYEIIDGMIDESLWVAVTWSVDAGIMAYDNPNIKYIIPKEGTIMWLEHMIIPKGAKNKVNAEAFINFIHRPDIYARIANYQSSPGVNIPAREFINEEIMNDRSLNLLKEDYDKLENYHDFSPSQEILDARHDIWEELIA